MFSSSERSWTLLCNHSCWQRFVCASDSCMGSINLAKTVQRLFIQEILSKQNWRIERIPSRASIALSSPTSTLHLELSESLTGRMRQSFPNKSPRKEDLRLGDGARSIQQLLFLPLLFPSRPLRPPVLKTSSRLSSAHSQKTQSPLFHHIDMALSLPGCLKRSAPVKLWKKNGSCGGGAPPVGFLRWKNKPEF